MRLLFIIPFVSQEYAKNWQNSCKRLESTLQSLKNQKCQDFAAMIVSNDLPQCDLDDPRFHFIQTSLKIDDPSRRGRRAIDKQRKIHWALVEMRRFRPEYVMMLDADDLISNRLVSWVDRNRHIDGFLINRGYFYTEGSNYFDRSFRFNKSCGSCYIVKARYVDPPAVHSRYDTNDYLSHWMVQSHNKQVNKDFRKLACSWRYVPFFAAVYRRNAHSEINVRLDLGTTRNNSLGQKIIKKIRQKKITPRLKQEFAGLSK